MDNKILMSTSNKTTPHQRHDLITQVELSVYNIYVVFNVKPRAVKNYFS